MSDAELCKETHEVADWLEEQHRPILENVCRRAAARIEQQAQEIAEARTLTHKASGMIQQLGERADAAEAKCEEYCKDAERYRWLLDAGADEWDAAQSVDSVNAYIDAALAAKEKE
jgi:hypothetical protein